MRMLMLIDVQSQIRLTIQYLIHPQMNTSISNLGGVAKSFDADSPAS